MSELQVNKISKYTGNNISVDNSLNLKSYDTTAMNALTAVAGDVVYNTTANAPYYYNGTTWKVMKDLVPLTIDYLVLAGGGGASSDWGAGGGAGGYRTTKGTYSGGNSSVETPPTLSNGDTFTVTVGAGGTGRTDGSDSVFYNVTSAGGGFGASGNVSAGDGGSGGGGNYQQTAIGSGTSGQGTNGGAGQSQVAGGRTAGSGGGGAGNAGQQAANYDNGGNGGNGLVNPILSSTNATSSSVGEVSGTDVYYASGGSGSIAWNSTGNPGTSPLGGGGDGADHGGAGQDGVANTGGGAGGCISGSSTGGSGVVIIRYTDTASLTIPGTLTATTYTESSEKVTVFTAGTGTVTITQ